MVYKKKRLNKPIGPSLRELLISYYLNSYFALFNFFTYTKYCTCPSSLKVKLLFVSYYLICCSCFTKRCVEFSKRFITAEKNSGTFSL